MKAHVPAIIFLVFAFALSACGGVKFETPSGSNFRSCSDPSANLANCYNGTSLKSMQQSVQVKSNVDVDILFVVDNSGSMQEEQVGIGNKINGFLDKIKYLNWQIALTTTDDRATTPDAGGTDRAWSDGNFRPFGNDTGSMYIMRSSQVSAANAQSLLSGAIQVGTKGSGTERGINSSYRAVERFSQPGMQRDFFRPNARLAVVLISDEDECSTGLANCPAASAGKSQPQNLVNLVKAQLGGSKVFSFNSIIYIPDDAGCTTGGNQGKVYKEMTELTGGVMGSVCSNDFATPLAALGNRVVEMINSVSLNCAPEDINGDGTPDVKIQLANGQIVSGGYTISGINLNFPTALPEGTHRFWYFCK